MRSLSLVLALSLAVLIFGCSDDSGSQKLPDAIPTFTGAERVPDSGISEENAFSATWRTPQDVPAVREFFERELAEGTWRIVETREIENGVVIRVEDKDDPESGGAIVVRDEGGSTRIGETIGRNEDEDHAEADNSGDTDGGAGNDSGNGGGSGQAASDELPQGYPSDVPLPDDADIVSGIAPLVETSQYYLVEFTTESSPADLIAYFNEELSSQGWEAGASENDPGAFILNFSRGGDSVTVTGGGAEGGTSASVTIIVEG
jgi:hypothetical protein